MDADREGFEVRRETAWDSLIGIYERGDSWVHQGLLPVARLARIDDGLRKLSPFWSLNRLCFSRYGVSRYPYKWLDRENVDQYIGDAVDAADAVAMASAALPAKAGEVWLGTGAR